MAARGFHNVPALYGDETVRPPERITGIISGFEAMGKVRSASCYLKSSIDRIGNWAQSVGQHFGLVFAPSRRCSTWGSRCLQQRACNGGWWACSQTNSR